MSPPSQSQLVWPAETKDVNMAKDNMAKDNNASLQLFIGF